MVKVKICGISILSDAVTISALGADMLGFLTDPISPRFVKPEFLKIVKNQVPSPIVSVNVKSNLEEMLVRSANADILQVHRVLNQEELEMITSFQKKVILFVPISEKYLPYLKKAIDFTEMVLLDLERKEDRPNMELISKVLRDYPGLGVGGGITLSNVSSFVALEPGWIDVSRGVESYPGKKNLELVKKLLEVAK
ncbi:phosphoribosylanthranilate isomerase [Metallosphaera tengchongensis]|uniref:N-(5'-phosphoribosyl)anthranilate isomerase n=1 Tax=Metallosphaera tengchongensis TaxID=1532350 RepID=A0A6N0NRF8_9CREN|nr:phosphoribosylanthranilate isomerase [Metallosphaera tengchongensis]QKQ99335.1 phosphoribosylanthranilate isomerase [Metallosphaera tengchongensis]